MKAKIIDAEFEEIPPHVMAEVRRVSRPQIFKEYLALAFYSIPLWLICYRLFMQYITNGTLYLW